MVFELGKVKGKIKFKKVLSVVVVLVVFVIGIFFNVEVVVDYSIGGIFGGGMVIGFSSYVNINVIVYGYEVNVWVLEDVVIGYKIILGVLVSGFIFYSFV